MESSLLNNRWSPLTPDGSSGLHVDYGHKFGRATTKVKCTWSPGGLQKIHLDSGGVHLEKVGQGKVLSALGILYALWWAFGPMYIVFWVLMVLVGIHMALWDWRWEVAQGDVAAVFCRWSVSGCIAG